MKLHKRILVMMCIYALLILLVFLADAMRVEYVKDFSSIKHDEMLTYKFLTESIKSESANKDEVIAEDNEIANEEIKENYQDTLVVESTTLNSSVTLTSLPVPNIDSSFKTWMAWQVWERYCPNSAQYKFFKNNGWVDSQGFVRCSAEKDLGIEDDYYMVAMGSYYGTTLGTKYKITLDTGKVFYAILGEFKANIHTNSTNQYSVNNNDIVEFVIDENLLNPIVKSSGSANVYPPLNGRVAKIERIDFIK